ncbi:MAG: hypothetical protein P8Y91_10570 [Desulfuromonadales bacterium]
MTIPFFKNISPHLGWGYVVFATFVIVGTSNAVNLTDGLDGLAIGPVVIAGVTYMIFAYVAGNIKIADYLQIVSDYHVAAQQKYCETCEACTTYEVPTDDQTDDGRLEVFSGDLECGAGLTDAFDGRMGIHPGRTAFRHTGDRSRTMQVCRSHNLHHSR